MTSEHDDELEEELVSVREVQDEATATLLADFLRSHGIEASVVSAQMPWLSTIETLHQGYWGKVEVLGKDADRARALIEDFLNATPQPESNEDAS